MPHIRDEIDPTRFWDSDDRFQAWSFARELDDHYRFATTEQSDVIHYHDGLIWLRRGEQILRDEVRRILRDASSREIVNEVDRNLRALTRTPRDEILDLPPELLVVRNGIVNLRTGEFTHRDRLDFAPGTMVQLDVEYDPDAIPYSFQDFLFDVLPRDDVSIMWELIGYCLLREYPFQKAFMLIGDGANGKSTLLDALREFLGEENIASAELQELEDDRFAVADLEGKLANLAPDLSKNDLKATGKFKSTTGGDLIRAQRKHEDSFEFRNFATMIFAANQKPHAEDDTFAYKRRWLHFQFPNTFTGGDAIPQGQLLDLFRAEHSGILNMAIESVQDLLERGEFEETTYDLEYEDADEVATNSAVEFAADHVERAEAAFLRIQHARTAYEDWCDDVGRESQGMQAFRRAVRNQAGYPAVVDDPSDGRYTAWAGVTLDSEYDPREDERGYF